MRPTTLSLLLAAALAAGCSSSSSATDGGLPDGGAAVDAPGPARDGGAGGILTWKYDGVMHSANSIVTLHNKTGVIDVLDVVAGESTGDGLSFILSDLDPNDAITITGTYECPGTNVISLLFTYNLTGSNSPMSCTVTVTQPGTAGVENAVGTFAAVLSNGKAITDGVFNTPIGTVIHL